MSLRITKVVLHSDGHVEANVTAAGVTRRFHDKHGSWVTDRKRSDTWAPGVTMREAARPVAMALSDRARVERKRAGVPVMAGGRR